jgi:hypothetical protein
LFDGIISLYLTVAKDISSPQARTKKARDLPSSNAQHDQFDKSDTDQQHSKRHGIVFEPIVAVAALPD